MKNLFSHFLILLLTFLQPIAGILFTLGAVVLLDMVTGILAARKNGVAINSKKLSHTISKTFVYMGCVLVTHAADVWIIRPAFNFQAIYIISGVILLTEIVSLDENIKAYTGKGIFKAIIDLLNKKGLNSDKQ